MADNLQERLRKRRQKIKDRSQGGHVFYPKEGTTRIRILPVTGTEDDDWGLEVIHFYLGNEIKGILSAATVGKPCPVMEAYERLKASKNPSDKDLAKALSPKTKYLVAGIVYKEGSKEIDPENSGKLIQLTGGVYGTILDFYLDPDLGDFTDFEEGYDIKIIRRGSGKMDTEYETMAMRPSAIPKEWRKTINIKDLFLQAALPYEEAAEKVKEFLDSYSEEDLDDAPVKKKRNEDSEDKPSRTRERRERRRGDA